MPSSFLFRFWGNHLSNPTAGLFNTIWGNRSGALLCSPSGASALGCGSRPSHDAQPDGLNSLHLQQKWIKPQSYLPPSTAENGDLNLSLESRFLGKVPERKWAFCVAVERGEFSLASQPAGSREQWRYSHSRPSYAGFFGKPCFLGAFFPFFLFKTHLHQTSPNKAPGLRCNCLRDYSQSFK